MNPESWASPSPQIPDPALLASSQFNFQQSTLSQPQMNEQPLLTPPLPFSGSPGPSGPPRTTSQHLSGHSHRSISSSPRFSPYSVPLSSSSRAHLPEGRRPPSQSPFPSPIPSPITPLMSGSPADTPPPEVAASSSSAQQPASLRTSLWGRGSSAPPRGRMHTASGRSRIEGSQQIQISDLDVVFSNSMEELDKKKERGRERKAQEHELKVREHEHKVKEMELKASKYKAEALRLQYSPAAIDLEKQRMQLEAQRSRELQAHQERIMSMYL